MTAEELLAVYPQFRGIAGNVTELFVSAANRRFSFLEEEAETARMLWTAHRLTLYAMTAAEGADVSSPQLADAGQMKYVTGKKVGDVSVTMSTACDAKDAGADDLGLTLYGRQLRGLIAGGTVYVR